MPAYRGDSTSPLVVRPLLASDRAAFGRFLQEVPHGEMRFLKEDLSDPDSAFLGFLDPSAPTRMVAVAPDGELAGLAAIVPGEGWSAHVAELRVIVSASRRGRGTGRALVRAALTRALEAGCDQVFVEVISEQDALVTMFQDLGFLPEALLPDFVRDGSGVFHDLMLLTKRLDERAGFQRLFSIDEVVT